MRTSELIEILTQIVRDITDLAISYAYGEHAFINDETGHVITAKAVRKGNDIIVSYRGASHTFNSVDDTLAVWGEQAHLDLLQTYGSSYLKWLERQEGL